MPNLVELIRRIGGPDAIPDATDGANEDGSLELTPHDYWDIIGRDGLEDAAMLKDRRSGRIYAQMYRLRDCLLVHEWHLKEGSLYLHFDIPADWSGSAWGLPFTSIEDVHTASYDLDRLAAEALDYRIGAIQKATETYVHVRRDRFVF
jgi:hypothetical protein